MSEFSTPTVEEFLVAPLHEIARVAPLTMVYAPGGTRRQAVFKGIEPWSKEYMQWALAQTLASCALMFEHGVQHLFTPVFVSTNFKEVNRHRQELFRNIHRFLSDERVLAEYQRLGWRVRLIGAARVPELQETAEVLKARTETATSRTLYWLIVPEADAPWQELIETAHATQAKTRTELIRAVYGQEIPLATLYLAFGKPMVSLEIIPPLLMGPVHCYWSQQPGYTLTEKQFRTILYDYAYLRNTWQQEKLDRARDALPHRHIWEQEVMVGLGMRLGPFWYPLPTAPQDVAHANG